MNGIGSRRVQGDLHGAVHGHVLAHVDLGVGGRLHRQGHGSVDGVLEAAEKETK